MNKMNLKTHSPSLNAVKLVMSIIPKHLAREIERIGTFRRDFPDRVCEIRIRCFGRSSISVSGENIPLFSDVTPNEMSELFDRVIGGSLYAHTKDLREGFVSLDFGVRVGVCGTLGDVGSLPKSIGGLVFRIPSGRCSCEDELFEAYNRPGTLGMLIYSLPGAGKTSALRALAGRISRELIKKVVVVDERREFIGSDYKDAMVDILCGYSKPRGVEIALRTLGAEVIMVDEIGNAEEGESLLRVGRGGVPIIATTHAASYGEVTSKEGIAPLIREGYFNRFVRLYKEDGRFSYEID